jgi:hypothetical protein
MQIVIFITYTKRSSCRGSVGQAAEAAADGLPPTGRRWRNEIPEAPAQCYPGKQTATGNRRSGQDFGRTAIKKTPKSALRAGILTGLLPEIGLPGRNLAGLLPGKHQNRSSGPGF